MAPTDDLLTLLFPPQSFIFMSRLLGSLFGWMEMRLKVEGWLGDALVDVSVA